MSFQIHKRFASATFASALAFSMALPVFSGSAIAAPLPVSTTLSGEQMTGSGLPAEQVRYRRRGYNAGAAVALGVLGLGIAAVVAQQRRDRYRERYEYYNGGYYNQGYYGRSYAPRRSYYYNQAPGFYNRY